MDNLTPEKRSKVMRSIVGKNTRPELKLRFALFRRGHRFRIHYSSENIDLAFVSRKVAVYVDGCYWHGCPYHFKMPTSNVRFWKKKILRNRERDADRTKSLKKRGWKVVRVWEHQVLDDEKLLRAVSRIEKFL